MKKSVLFISTFLAFTSLEANAQQPSPPSASSAAATAKAHNTKAKKADPKASATPGDKPNSSTNLFGGDGGDRAKGPTEITSKDQAQFDSRGRIAVFLGEVKVVDPQFTMTSDKLTAYLNKEDEGGGLRQADGEGNVTIVHLNQPKTTAAPGQSPAPVTASTPTPAPGTPTAAQTPVRSTAKAEKAVYVSKDGTITLTGWPQVTQGVNTHVSTEPGAKMIIYNDGRLQTFGSTRTIIQDRSEPNKSNSNGPH